MSNDEADELVKSHVSKLAEHFEVVQVLVSRHSDGDGAKTHSCFRGAGNFYARVGMAASFIDETKACELAAQIKDSRE